MTRKSFWLILCFVSVSWLYAGSRANAELRSLEPKEILTKLDLSMPELEAVKAKQATDRVAALGELLTYYRKKYPLDDPSPSPRPSLPVPCSAVHPGVPWGPMTDPPGRPIRRLSKRLLCGTIPRGEHGTGRPAFTRR